MNYNVHEVPNHFRIRLAKTIEHLTVTPLG